MKYKSRADLLIAAGGSIRMQEAEGVKEPLFKSEGFIHPIPLIDVSDLCFDREFPISVVEGKPVFIGDELYTASGTKFTADYACGLYGCSWNPPKPKTVTVELLLDVANIAARWDAINGWVHAAIGEACKKALGELK